MPSRKRAQGKERKAKAKTVEQQAATGSNVVVREKFWEKLARGQCNHGFVAIPASGHHPVSSYLDEYEDHPGHPSGMNMLHFLQETHKQHKQLLDNECHRKMIISILLSMGTNSILRGDNVDYAKSLAQGAILLEHYQDDFGLACLDVGAIRAIRDVSGCGERDVVRFYKKRLGCSCLKDKYAQSKSQPKHGKCGHCKKTFERASLMVCDRCKTAQYCSVKCQRADWKEHKGMCDGILMIPLIKGLQENLHL